MGTASLINGTYKGLGVKPHVQAAANEIGAKFNIKQIGGYRTSGNKGSDHPKRLALDFMTSNPRTRKALSDYAVANASRLGVTYVIHDMKIWSKERAKEGWRTYNPVSKWGDWQHVRHVHVSFDTSAGSGTNNGVSVVPAANPLIPDSVENAFSALTNPQTWVRVMMFVIGFVLIGIALFNIDKAGTKQAVRSVMRSART